MTIEPYSIRYAIGAPVLPPKPERKVMAPMCEAEYAKMLAADAIAIRKRQLGQTRAVNPEAEAAKRASGEKTARIILSAFKDGAETLPQVMMTHTILDASARLAVKNLIMAGEILVTGKTKSGAKLYAVRGKDA